MTGPFHTLVYPTALGAERQGLALPSKTPSAVRSYALDMTDFVASAGSLATGVEVDADASVARSGVSITPAGMIGFTVSGGDPAVANPVIYVRLLLATGNVEETTLVQPIEALLAGTPPASGSVVHPAFSVVDLAAIWAGLPLAPPAGVGQPWNNGHILSFSGGAAAGTGNITPAMLAAALAGLPTSAPSGAGLPWNDGGVVTFTAGATQGTTIFTAADLSIAFAGLPTSLPTTPGQPWNDGHILAAT